MASFFLRGINRWTKKKWQLLSKQTQWFIAYRTDRSKFIANTSEIVLSDFTPILPPKNHSFADPHVFAHEGTDYIFFEDWDHVKDRGSIAFIPFDRHGKFGPIQTVLDLDYHLSNPFVFDWQGSIYMIPEGSERKTVQLFRARRFPEEWELDRELMWGHEMVDATLHYHEGRWFMFVNTKERSSCFLNDELFLFVAATPLGPWQPHPRNPIKSDACSARPAGRLFWRDGKLIRPSQDCSRSYGAAINLCAVDELSESEYREHIVARIEPTWWPNLEGCHGLSSSDRLEVIDGTRKRLRF